TKKEQELITSKLKIEQGQTARVAFNALVTVKGDDKATNTNVLSVQNFLKQVGGTAAWQQIQNITGVEYNAPNQATKEDQSSNIKMTIGDTGKFLHALEKDGYDVNGIGDFSRKLGQTVYRNFWEIVAGAINNTTPVITNPANHPFDNARASTPGHN